MRCLTRSNRQSGQTYSGGEIRLPGYTASDVRVSVETHAPGAMPGSWYWTPTGDSTFAVMFRDKADAKTFYRMMRT
jgi:hypothetical protein